jgi:exopolysaccharide biosynthesis glucuronosyltransferase PssD
MSTLPEHKRADILVVSSGGGHWVEMRRLLPALDGYETVFVSVPGVAGDIPAGARFHAVTDVTRWSRLAFIRVIWELWRIFRRERPAMVITTGAAPGLLALGIGRLFGAKAIWVDSLANVDKLSLSGQLGGRVAHVWLTQWAHLAKPDGPHYQGKVL